eukprot:351686-Chlamydomonas_euryale.AAC.1
MAILHRPQIESMAASSAAAAEAAEAAEARLISRLRASEAAAAEVWTLVGEHNCGTSRVHLSITPFCEFV